MPAPVSGEYVSGFLLAVSRIGFQFFFCLNFSSKQYLKKKHRHECRCLQCLMSVLANIHTHNFLSSLLHLDEASDALHCWYIDICTRQVRHSNIFFFFICQHFRMEQYIPYSLFLLFVQQKFRNIFTFKYLIPFSFHTIV